MWSNNTCVYPHTGQEAWASAVARSIYLTCTLPVNLSFSTNSTQLTLTMDDGIWHSSVYSVRVVAENEYGVSPPAASTFPTPVTGMYVRCSSIWSKWGI